MSKWDKLLTKICALSKDLRFDELRKVLESYGYVMNAPKSGLHKHYLVVALYLLKVLTENSSHTFLIPTHLKSSRFYQMPLAFLSFYSKQLKENFHILSAH